MPDVVRDHPAAGQTYRERRPAPALDGVVSAVWVQRIPPGAGPYTQRNLPDGSIELVCKLGATPRIVGPRTHPMVEILAPGTTVVGARFHPGAASSVLGVAASELVDSTVMSDDLWGSSAVAIGELVGSSASPAEAVAVLQRRIIARLTDALPRDPIVTETVRLLLGGGMDEIGSLASSLSISPRPCRPASRSPGPTARHGWWTWSIGQATSWSCRPSGAARAACRRTSGCAASQPGRGHHHRHRAVPTPGAPGPGPGIGDRGGRGGHRVRAGGASLHGRGSRHGLPGPGRSARYEDGPHRVRPSWVGVIDFETRLPSTMGGVTGRGGQHG
jgi:hypothetical protein